MSSLPSPTPEANQVQIDSFKTANHRPPTHILNLTTSLFLKIKNTPKNPVHIPLVHLNSILHTSPFLHVHQYFFDAYFACTKVNLDTFVKHSKVGAANPIKKYVTAIIGGMLKYDISVKESMDMHQQQRTPNPVVIESAANFREADPYELLGIRKLENFGHWFDWEGEFTNKVVMMFENMELGVGDDGEVFVLGSDSHEGMDESVIDGEE